MKVWVKRAWVLPVGLALAVPAASLAQQQTPAAEGQMAPAPDGPGNGPMHRHMDPRAGGEDPQMERHFALVRHDAPEPGMMGMHHEMSMHHGDFWKDPETVKRLALTTEQVKKLDGIKEAGEIEAIHLRAAVEEQQVKLRSMMESETFDQKATDLAIDRMADAHAALEKAEAKSRVNARAVLTPDQWTKLHTPPERGEWHRSPMQGPA